ncbi:MAG: TIGR02710 family CRISPR-associated CARF protein [Candidatus Caldarchaeum sp.]
MSEINKGLIITVGLQAEPIVFSIRHHQPHCVAFILTAESRKTLDKICEQANLQPANYNTFEVEDRPEEIGNVIRKAYEAWQWLKRQNIPEDKIIFDPTGGRKWMSAGLIIFAAYNGKNLSYVDVKYENAEVVQGSEKVIELGNPEALTGFLQADRGIFLFNQKDFYSAHQAFKNARKAVSDSAEADLYGGLALFAEAVDKWDKFEHYNKSLEQDFEKAFIQLERGAKSRRMPREWIQRLREFADTITSISIAKEKPCYEALIDLYLNAERKEKLGKIDDATARIYRCLEAMAEYLLRQKNPQLTPSQITSSDVPSNIQGKFRELSGKPLPEKLGVTDQWLLLLAWEDPIAKEHYTNTPDQNKAFTFSQYLQLRNNSILAHGWTPVKRENFDRFRETVKEILRKIDQQQFDQLKNQLNPPEIPNLWNP